MVRRTEASWPVLTRSTIRTTIQTLVDDDAILVYGKPQEYLDRRRFGPDVPGYLMRRAAQGDELRESRTRHDKANRGDKIYLFRTRFEGVHVFVEFKIEDGQLVVFSMHDAE